MVSYVVFLLTDLHSYLHIKSPYRQYMDLLNNAGTCHQTTPLIPPLSCQLKSIQFAGGLVYFPNADCLKQPMFMRLITATSPICRTRMWIMPQSFGRMTCDRPLRGGKPAFGKVIERRPAAGSKRRRRRTARKVATGHWQGPACRIRASKRPARRGWLPARHQTCRRRGAR